MKFNFYALVLLMFVFPLSINAQAREVALQKAMLPTTGKLEGMSNIFFHKLEGGNYQYDRSWAEVEITTLLDSKGFSPISVIRFKDRLGKIEYTRKQSCTLRMQSIHHQ